MIKGIIKLDLHDHDNQNENDLKQKMEGPNTVAIELTNLN